MARAAQERGLRVLGLSEHVFQMSEARPLLAHMPEEGPLLSFTQYIEQVQEARQQTGLDVRLGLEVDFIPDKNVPVQAAIQPYPWDFLIGSVHEIDGVMFEHIPITSREQGEQLWLRYFQLLREAVTSGYFSLVSHPVRMHVKNAYLPATFDEELAHLAAEATRSNVALELNGYDTLTYPNAVRRLARACAMHDTPVSVGSDAHVPRQVAQAHVQTHAIMREAGLSHVRIWRNRAMEEYTLFSL
jgi:histidinol-phosphatase (PHP family)